MAFRAMVRIVGRIPASMAQQANLPRDDGSSARKTRGEMLQNDASEARIPLREAFAHLVSAVGRSADRMERLPRERPNAVEQPRAERCQAEARDLAWIGPSCRIPVSSLTGPPSFAAVTGSWHPRRAARCRHAEFESARQAHAGRVHGTDVRSSAGSSEPFGNSSSDCANMALHANVKNVCVPDRVGAGLNAKDVQQVSALICL